jgi:hypothetical protein
MSKKAAARAAEPKEKILPLPKTVLAHHGQQFQALLDQWATSGNVSPVLLISGPGGVGKRAVAHHLGQWLLCEKNPLSAPEAEPEGPGLFGGLETTPAPSPESQALPCNECMSCRSLGAGEALNFTEISPEASDSGRMGTLKIEQFRALRESQGHGAFRSRYRVTLISSADHMTIAAGNSLLKLLEEPPPGWIFFMTAADPSLVLPTLVSRCQKMRLRPFTSIELENLLAESGVAGDRRRLSADLAQGSWGRALALAEDATWERQAKLLAFLENPAAELESWVDWAAKDPQQFGFLLDQLELIVNRLLRLSLAEAPGAALYAESALRTHFDKVVRVQGSADLARSLWLECAEKLALARERAHLPLNRKLLAQEVLMPWLQGA